MMCDQLKKVCKVRGKCATGPWKPSPLPIYVQLNLSTLFYKRNQICNSIPNLNLTKISNNCLIPQINFPQILVFELNHWFSKLQYFILHKTVKNSTTYHPAAHTCTFTQYIAKIQKCPPLPCFSLKVIFLHSPETTQVSLQCWRISSACIFHHWHHYCLQSDAVPEIEDDQPRNPFTELRLLSSHKDIVHLLTVIDERRYM